MSTKPIITAGVAALLAGGLATAPALAATSHAAAAKPTSHAFREVEVGSRLSATGLRYEDAYRVKSSPWGEGTTIRDGGLAGTTFPAKGSAAIKAFYRNGRVFAKEAYTVGVPSVYGIAPITGTGACTSGTGSHLGQTCTYTIKGSYDMLTETTHLTLTGTYIDPASSTKKTS